MEHRCGVRWSTTLAVTIRGREGSPAKGMVRDISASGALLESPIQLPLNVVATIRFEAKNAVAGSSSATGEVVRHVPGGFAVEWDEFSPRIVQHVQLAPLASLTDLIHELQAAAGHADAAGANAEHARASLRLVVDATARLRFGKQAIMPALRLAAQHLRTTEKAVSPSEIQVFATARSSMSRAMFEISNLPR